MDTNIAGPTPMEVLPFQPLKGEPPMLDIPFVVGIDGRQFRGERLVEQLKGLNRQAAQSHLRRESQWGQLESLSRADGYDMRMLMVAPGRRCGSMAPAMGRAC